MDGPGISEHPANNRISSILYSGTTTSLHVSISIAWGTHPVKPAALGATFFTGDPVQVCFKTVVEAKCAAQSIANAATAITVADNGDSDAPAGNGSGTAMFTAAPDPSVCVADLQIVKSAQPGVIVPSTNATYRLEAKNNGPDAAQDVVVSDHLPGGLSFVSASPGCSFAGGTVTCRLSSLVAGAFDKFTVVAHIASSVDHRVTNTASVTSGTRDSNPANNTSSTTQPIDQRVDVAITKTPSRTIVPPGGQVTYTLFIDHEKSVYVSDLELILGRGWLHPGAVVVADNVKFPGAPEYRAYLKQRQNKRWRTVEHEAHLEYQSLLKDLMLESDYLGGPA